MRKITRLGGLFLGAALMAFALLAPQTASSATRNFAGAGCHYDSGNNVYTCSLVTDGTTYTVAAFDGARFHFVCPGAGNTVPVEVDKIRTSGSVFTDIAFHNCVGSGTENHFVPAVNVLNGASVNDYLKGLCFFPSAFHGVQATF